MVLLSTLITIAVGHFLAVAAQRAPDNVGVVDEMELIKRARTTTVTFTGARRTYTTTRIFTHETARTHTPATRTKASKTTKTTSTTGAATCSPGVYTGATSGCEYNVLCDMGYYFEYGTQYSTTVASFDACLSLCDADTDCLNFGYFYTNDVGACYINDYTSYEQNPGYTQTGEAWGTIESGTCGHAAAN